MATPNGIAADLYFGYNPPFFGGKQGVLSRQSGRKLVQNDVLQLLLTNVGERVNRPTYGTILKASLFEPMTDRLVQDIQANIANQIAEFEPRVQVQVNVVRNDDRNMLQIVVQGFFTNDRSTPFLVEVELPFQQGVTV